jgi:hypothetical protein
VCDACPTDYDNDIDGDVICGDIDNCPNIANPGQENADNDTLGDVCDACPNDPDNDIDNDGVCGDIDGCPTDGNKTVPGICGCGTSDDDTDTDGIADCNDNCPNIANPGQGNADNDTMGDICDPCPNDAGNDIDGDEFCGDVDNCPNIANPGQENVDNDTIGDMCDADTVYGYVSGHVIEDIAVWISRPSCGTSVLIDNATTNTAGYYSFGNLPNGSYDVSPDNASYLFSPEIYNVQIPQAAIQSYDFSSTDPSHPIFGTWTAMRGEVIFEIKFKSNGNFDLHGWIDVGTYTISGNQITLLDINCGTQ